jgi:hypothetical protein
VAPRTLRPYVGVNGVTSSAQVAALLEEVPTGANRLLSVGILANRWTVAEAKEMRPADYPRSRDIPGIAVQNPRILNLIHYTSPDRDLYSSLHSLTERFGERINGFQINVRWPRIVELVEYRQTHPLPFLVLRLDRDTLESIREAPADFKKKLRNYVRFIDAILLDWGGPENNLLDPTRALPCLRIVMQQIVGSDPAIGIGVAGGLGPDTLDVLHRLIEIYPELSIDAPINEGYIAYTQKYIAAAFETLEPTPPCAA